MERELQSLTLSELIFILVLHVLAKKNSHHRTFKEKNFFILLKEGYDFLYKFQQILEKFENDRQQIPFVSEENNYSKKTFSL